MRGKVIGAACIGMALMAGVGIKRGDTSFDVSILTANSTLFSG